MIVQYVEINHKNDNNHNKGDIINVSKAAVRKSIFMQITGLTGKWIHSAKIQGCHINVNK
jgi:hypothetical protein